jgi:hypothetical protein
MQEDPPKPDPEVDEPVTQENNQSEPEATPASGLVNKHKHHLRRFKTWYKSHKKWSIPSTVLLLLIIIAAVPYSRYELAGLVIKKNFTVQITDATANNPVSGVTVSSGSVQATTNANGIASLRLRVGSHTFSINKKYYLSRQAYLVVPLLKEKQPDVALVATGRQVKINVTNLITGTALSGVNITVADTSAKTNSNGSALLVVPAGKTSQGGSLSLAGYNDSAVDVAVSNTSVKENDFMLTPTGKVYFVSNASGQLNVMKANLDGSQPQVVVAATGNEDPSTTSLLQSPDGKYVALIAKRTTTDSTAQIYVLAAADDKLLQIDSGNAVFSLYGWINDNLIYGANRQDLPSWQQGVGKLKSYDASSGNTTLLDQTAGSDATTNINETYDNVIISGDQVIYSKTWSGDQTTNAGKQNTIQIIGVDGENHAVVASYDATTETQYLYPHSPVSFYIDVQSLTAGGPTTDYDYTVGSTPKAVTLTGDQLTANDTNYYFSPSGDQTFWSVMRDGQNTLLVGDSSGANANTVGSLNAYTAYGWYTDNYLLISLDNNQLLIMGTKGGNSEKIADYLATTPNY